jgi:hypothetical protein
VLSGIIRKRKKRFHLLKTSSSSRSSLSFFFFLETQIPRKGDLVQRGRDWNEDKHGGEDSGSWGVVELTGAKTLSVKWENNTTKKTYRYGFNDM